MPERPEQENPEVGKSTAAGQDSARTARNHGHGRGCQHTRSLPKSFAAYPGMCYVSELSDLPGKSGAVSSNKTPETPTGRYS
jgi:hypothetical protein